MELICPSCEARYQLPEGAIGEKGRQVSCMNCGHGWHAFPPLVLGATVSAAPKDENAGIPFGPAAGAAVVADAVSGLRTSVATNLPGVDDEVVTSGGVPEKRSNSRSEQLAEIREMLAEVQSEEQEQAARVEDIPDPTPTSLQRVPTAPVTEAARPDPAEAPAARPVGALSEADDIDTLRARLQQHGDKGEKPKPVDINKLRRKHDRKERVRKREKNSSSGAFMTGFLLVAIIAAVMIAVYVLHPAIIERMPGTEAALTEYVATIDGLRVSVAETFEQAKSWVIEKSDKS